MNVRRFSLRTMMIAVIVIAASLVVLREGWRTETTQMTSLAIHLPVPRGVRKWSPEALSRFEQELEAWFVSRGYERSDFGNFRHRYIFRPLDPPTQNRLIVVDFSTIDYLPQGPTVELWVKLRRWKWERLPPIEPTKEESNLTQELLEWLRQKQ
jgi:hypothetical protein